MMRNTHQATTWKGSIKRKGRGPKAGQGNWNKQDKGRVVNEWRERTDDTAEGRKEEDEINAGQATRRLVKRVGRNYAAFVNTPSSIKRAA